MNTLLLAALSKKNFSLALNLLKKIPLHLLKETDEEGKTFAHEFAEQGMLEGLQYLANNPLTKTLLTAKDNQGCTPFLVAVLCDQLNIVNYFIANQYDNFSSKAHAAAFFGRLEEIKALNENDWDVKNASNINLPVHGVAIAAGQTEVLKFLCEKNASLMPPNYPELFTDALNLKHEETALFLLKKISHIGFLNQIATLMKVLAKNPATNVEILNKVELVIEGVIPSEYKLNYYPLFIAGAIIHNDLKIFNDLIQKFLKQKMYLSEPTTLQGICIFISKHRQFQFARVLAEKLLEESLDLVAAFCCYFIENNDDISLDIFLKTTKNLNERSINYLARQDTQFHLFCYALKKKIPAIIVILRRYFTTIYFLQSNRFFTSEEDLLIFFQDYLLKEPYKYMSDTPEHNQFTEAVNYVLSLPENHTEYYEIASENLRLCCKMPLAHKNLFAQKTIYSLNEIIDVYISAKQPNWPLFKRIFSDIKYVVLEAHLPIETNDLGNLLNLAFIFSDYQTVNEILNKLLSNHPDNQEMLTLNKITFFFVKIYTLLLSETDFSLSDDVKNLLLEEHRSFGSISPNFISDISLLTLLQKIQLTPETSQRLCKKLEEITPEKINEYISIRPLTLKSQMAITFFQSLRLLYDTLYQLKEWSDNITTKRESSSHTEQTDANTLKEHLIIISAYENCCRIKIFIFKTILELINLLASSRANTLIELPKDTLALRKWAKKKDWGDKPFYQDSLLHAESDFRQLSAAYLIVEDRLERLTKKSANQKTNKLPQKPEKKPTPALTKNARSRAKIVSPIEIYPSKIVTSNENDSKIPWKTAQSRNKKNHIQKKQRFSQFSKPLIQKTANASLRVSKKNNFSSVIPIALHQNAKLDQNTKPCSLEPDAQALKKYLSNYPNNPKILPNSLLAKWGFAINLPQKVKEFFEYFKPNQLFLVGGAIRNSLARKPINDFDFIVLLSAEKIKEMFPRCRVKGKGKKIILTLSYGNHEFDILPIECTSYQEALMRDQFDNERVLAILLFDSGHRDLTFNALYWNPWMGLIDFYGGIADLLLNRVINPIQSGSKPFEVQKAAHILRALRFAAQFHLTISEDLRRTMLSNTFFLYTVHIDKIKTEYQNLINAVGEIQAIQLYQHYFLYDLISTRISLNTLTWNDFWSSDMKLASKVGSSQELMPIEVSIKKYLSEKDLRALNCISTFTFFQPAKMQQVSPVHIKYQTPSTPAHYSPNPTSL